MLGLVWILCMGHAGTPQSWGQKSPKTKERIEIFCTLHVNTFYSIIYIIPGQVSKHFFLCNLCPKWLSYYGIFSSNTVRKLITGKKRPPHYLNINNQMKRPISWKKSFSVLMWHDIFPSLNGKLCNRTDHFLCLISCICSQQIDMIKIGLLDW